MSWTHPEAEFTRDNVLTWANEQTGTHKTVGQVLCDLLKQYWARSYAQYIKSHLIEMLMEHVVEGVDKPLLDKSNDELLDEIMSIGKDPFEIETMGEFVHIFVDGKWDRMGDDVNIP